MKKISILFAGLFIIFALSSQNLNAGDEGVSVSINSGIYTDDSFSFDPFYWTAGLNFDIHFSNYLMISPEFYVIVHNFDIGNSSLAPGVLLNLNLQGFFAGGGISKHWFLGNNETTSSDFLLKLNAGIRGSGFRLAAFIITNIEQGFFEYNTLGATIGFEFN